MKNLKEIINEEIKPFIKRNAIVIVKKSRLESLGQSIYDHKKALGVKNNECAELEIERDDLAKKLNSEQNHRKVDETKFKEEIKKLEISEKKALARADKDAADRSLLEKKLGGTTTAKNRYKIERDEARKTADDRDKLNAELVSEAEEKQSIIDGQAALIQNLNAELTNLKNKSEPATKEELERYEVTRKPPERNIAKRKFNR